jgi:hypothetical protein
MLVTAYKTTQWHNPEEHNLNLKRVQKLAGFPLGEAGALIQHEHMNISHYSETSLIRTAMSNITAILKYI